MRLELREPPEGVLPADRAVRGNGRDLAEGLDEEIANPSASPHVGTFKGPHEIPYAPLVEYLQELARFDRAQHHAVAARVLEHGRGADDTDARDRLCQRWKGQHAYHDDRQHNGRPDLAASSCGH